VSIQVVNWVFRGSRTQSPTEQLILLAIADKCSGDDGSGAYPSIATIARMTKLDARTVRRGIRALERCGDIVVEMGGGRGPSLYRVVVLGEVAATPRARRPGGEVTEGQSDRAPRAGRPIRGGVLPADPLINHSSNRTRTVITLASRRQPRLLADDDSVQWTRFERFWRDYRRKIAKRAAWREWLRIKPAPDDSLTDRIVADVSRKNATEWRDSEIRFIPHPRTYLHQARWEDESEETHTATARDDEGQRTARYLAELRSAR
jgi:hypothetical protein